MPGDAASQSAKLAERACVHCAIKLQRRLRGWSGQQVFRSRIRRADSGVLHPFVPLGNCILVPTRPASYHHMGQITVYGIPSCGTVKKARRWLDSAGHSHHWVDFRSAPPGAERIAGWVDVFGYRPLRSTSGRAYRTLPADRQFWEGEEWTSAFSTDPMLIRRLVVEVDGRPNRCRTWAISCRALAGLSCKRVGSGLGRAREPIRTGPAESFVPRHRKITHSPFPIHVLPI